MAKELILGTDVYVLTQQGDSPTWGEEVSSLLEGLVDSVNNISGPYDVNNNLFLFNNNVSANISGVSIDPTVVNGAEFSYSIRRETSSVTATEIGTLLMTYNSSNPVSSKFDVARQQAGSAGVSFIVNDSGVITITSNNLAGSAHVGRLRYSIRSFEV